MWYFIFSLTNFWCFHSGFLVRKKKIRIITVDGNALTRELKQLTVTMKVVFFYFFLTKTRVMKPLYRIHSLHLTKERQFHSLTLQVTLQIFWLFESVSFKHFHFSLKHLEIRNSLECFVVTEERLVPTKLMLVLRLTAVSWKEWDHHSQWFVGIL